MPKVRIKASSEDIEQAGQDRGDFVTPKPGVYVLTLTEVNYGYSKTDGEEDKTRPRLECIYKITGEGADEAKPTANYGNLWDYVSFSESSGWKRAEFLMAFGMLAEGASVADVEIDTDELVNRKVIARLKNEAGRTKDDPPRARIAKLIKYSANGLESGGEESAPVYGEDEGPSGDAEEVFGGDDGDGEDEVWYDVGALEALSLKELGAILKEEFEGNPQDCIVKVKGKTDQEQTKEAVINAILEAQGDPDTPDEDDDENPF